MAGNWKAASADLTSSLQEQDSRDGRFRLAAAEWNAGNREDSEELVRKLLSEGYEPQKALSPLELEAYSSFIQELLSAAKTTAK